MSKGPVVYFLVTVDGDLRVGSPEQQILGVRAMRMVHDDLGLLGRTTWMINELDFQWTNTCPSVLLDLLESGECVGVHDHFDTYFADTHEKASVLAAQSKRALGDFFDRQGRDVQLIAHRNGCAFQSEAIYQALRESGYSILSDVRPGMKWWGRMLRDGAPPNPWRCLGPDDANAILMDNSMLPLRAIPWRHDVQNWLDMSSDLGPFLQVPINSMPMLDRRRVSTAIAQESKAAFVCLDTHPYDMQDPDSGDVSPERVANYRESLEWVLDVHKPDFIRLDEVPKAWEALRA